MDIEDWIEGFKVRIFPWIDGKSIYVNVQYFAPGQSISKPPVWDKTAYIVDDVAGRRFAYEFTHTMVDYVSHLTIPLDGHVSIQVAS